MVYASSLSFCSFFEVMQPFLGKFVTVEIDSYRVIGKLIRFSHNNKNGHRPNVLFLQNEKELILVRGAWTAIKLLEPKQ
jgi:hypothetical protein